MNPAPPVTMALRFMPSLSRGTECDAGSPGTAPGATPVP